MNRGIWTVSMGLGLAGCGLLDLPSPLSEPPAAVSPQPAVVQTAAGTPDMPINESTVSQPPLALGSIIQQQDYAPTAPLPETGKVTIRDHIRNLEPGRLFADCPADSAPYAFAESTHYRVQVCSEEYDPWQPKYYMGQAKDGSGELRITSTNPVEARQLIFKSAGHTYILYRDAAQPELVNAYLQVFTPDGDSYAEALLYFYEATNSMTQ